MMYLVTVEGESDGMWWTDPNGFNTRAEASQYAQEIVPPDGHVVVIYSCGVLQIIDKDQNAVLAKERET